MLLEPRSAAARAALEPSWLVVARQEQAGSCPDAAELASLVEQLRDEAVRTKRVLLEVKFSQNDDVLVAHIRRAEEGSAARELRSHADDHDCTTLKAAVATAAALFLDTQVSKPPQMPVVPEAPEPVPVPPVRESKQPEAPSRVAFGVSGGVSLGVADDVTPIGLADSTFQHWPFRVGLSGMITVSSRRHFGPGNLDLQLLALGPASCFGVLRLSGLEAWICAGVTAGAVRAEASGYSENFSESQLWVAAPLDLEVHQRIIEQAEVSWAWTAGASLLLPITPHTFSVQGLGTAAELGPPIALFWVGVEVDTPL